MKAGLIGLGIMGKPMGKNLLKAGCELYVNNRSKNPVEELVQAGAHAATREQMGKECEVILTMLPNGPQVKEVVLNGEDAMIQYMHEGQVFIDMSSINPIDSKEISTALAAKGIEMLDAPVSGGEPKAMDGTLSFMVGGKQKIFDQYKELFEKMGSSVVRCGDIGAGNTTKLANQIIVACNIEALAEALTLAQKAGVDSEVVFQAIRGGLAGSAVMDAKTPMMIEGNSKPGFKIDLHIKDLNNAIMAAHEVGAPLPMTTQVMEIMEWLSSRGEGSSDHSAIAHFYEYLTGIEIGRH